MIGFSVRRWTATREDKWGRPGIDIVITTMIKGFRCSLMVRTEKKAPVLLQTDRTRAEIRTKRTSFAGVNGSRLTKMVTHFSRRHCQYPYFERFFFCCWLFFVFAIMNLLECGQRCFYFMEGISDRLRCFGSIFSFYCGHFMIYLFCFLKKASLIVLLRYFLYMNCVGNLQPFNFF